MIFDPMSFPRVRLAHLPTALEPMSGLSALLGRPRLYVKRDDCTGLGLGGNKTRKLEYLLGEARQQGADLLVTVGGIQSNHARQSAAAAVRAGLGCHLLLEEIMPEAPGEYRRNGNVLLDRLFGATVHLRPEGSDLEAEMTALCEELRSAGHRPYPIPSGGSSPIGALGYVQCAAELATQLEQRGVDRATIVTASASAGTHAGLLAGIAAAGRSDVVIGISVSRDAAAQESKVADLAARTLDRIGESAPLPGVQVLDDYVGAGYGRPTPTIHETLRLCARSEAMVLDPVYTGKAMTGLVDLVRSGGIDPGEPVVFLHTGGSPALFAYRWMLDGEAGAGSA